MSKIDELLKNEKVEWKKLGDIAEVTGAGVDKKKVLGESPIKLLNYMDIYKNQYINSSIPTMEVTAPYNKIQKCNIEFGDIFVTPSSETTDDIFRTAVAVESILNTVYSYHIMRVRLKNKSLTTSCYLNYLFQSEIFRKSLYKRVFGNTRKTIAKSEIEQLEIPIPSLETQEKIVKILDKFTNYVTELQTELQYRTKQYEYYRDKLLSEEYLNKIVEKIDGLEKHNEIFFTKISDLCLRQKGINITAEKMKELNKENAPVKIFAGGNTTANVEAEFVELKNIINKPSIIVKSRGNIDFEYYDKPFTHKNEMWSYSTSNEDVINIKFLFYILKNNLKYFKDNSISGKLPQISTGLTDNYKVPVPNIKIQNKVVEILDKFQSLLSDTQGLLPQEIKQRQKQYEYYREKLLTFDTKCGSKQASKQASKIIFNDYFVLLKEASDVVGVKLFEIEWKELGSIGLFENGTGLPKSLFDENGYIGAIHYGHIYTKYNIFVEHPIVKVSKKNADKLKKVNNGDLVIAKTSENIDDVMKTIAYIGSKVAVTGGHAAIFKHNENPKYLSYVFNGANYVLSQKNKLARGVKVIELSTTDMEKIKIPLPSLSVQEYIVSILDKFDTLTNDIAQGLPKEIELRQKQYEYYREKLLDFKRSN